MQHPSFLQNTEKNKLRVDLGTAVCQAKVLIVGVKCKLMIMHERLFKM